MGSPKPGRLSIVYRAINLYLAIGLLLAFPVFMSYLISTPILMVRLIQGHATIPHIISSSVFFPAFGLLSAIWRMLSWPYSLLGLINGEYASIWKWLAPGFAMQQSIPIR